MTLQSKSLFPMKIMGVGSLAMSLFGAAACSDNPEHIVHKRAAGQSGSAADQLSTDVLTGAKSGPRGPADAAPAKSAATPESLSCEVPKSNIRRLTAFEYNNTVRDVFGDDSKPGNDLPAEVIGNGFGNEAATLATSSLLVERYAGIAEKVAARVVSDAKLWDALHPCVQTVSAATETACLSEIIMTLAEKAFRKSKEDLAPSIAALQELYKTLRKDHTFKESVGGVIEGILQSSEFLYRPEVGAAVSGKTERPVTGDEMATRLSYFFWGSAPDTALRAAAKEGKLATPEGIRAQAERLLADPRARAMLRNFFDQYLPLTGLAGAVRDPSLFPTFSGNIGRLMREEAHRFLEHVIFEGGGDWPSALTAPYTMANKELAEFYGLPSTNLGNDFVRVPLDTSKRLGLLTLGGVMAGTTHSTHTNPVKRGAFILEKLLCIEVPFPTGDIAAQITPPKSTSAPTGRERFSQHSSDPACASCHKMLDPVGFTFENYDAVGLFRAQENGVTIDASGGIPGGAKVNDAIGLVRDLAASEKAMGCFAKNWANYAYGVKLTHDNQCYKDKVASEFKAAKYNVKEFLIRLAQTDYFLNLPP